MIFIAQLILKLSFEYLRDVGSLFKLSHFLVLSLATICIAAAGYVHNDIIDLKADRINKPHEVYYEDQISHNKTLLFCGLLAIIGISLGVGVSFVVGNLAYSWLFIITSALLYAYNSFLKRIPVVGNIVTSAIVTFSLLIVWIFETQALLQAPVENIFINEGRTIFYFVITLAFMLNLLRELVKDVQDLNGDYAMGYQTLPILIGSKRTMIVCTFITLAVLFNNALFTFIYANGILKIGVILSIFTVIPLAYIASKCRDAKNTMDYKHIARLLKVMMLLGILLIPILFISDHYA